MKKKDIFSRTDDDDLLSYLVFRILLCKTSSKRYRYFCNIEILLPYPLGHSTTAHFFFLGVVTNNVAVVVFSICCFCCSRCNDISVLDNRTDADADDDDTNKNTNTNDVDDVEDCV